MRNRTPLKVEIDTKISDTNSETVSTYVPIFKTGSIEALLKFLVLLKDILKGKNLKTSPHNYAMTKNILTREALQVFEQKTQ